MNIGELQHILNLWMGGVADAAELAKFRAELPRVFDDAIAWRKGADMLRKLQACVMPCGHAMESLIRVGGHGVTTCGQCLADKRTANEGLFYIQDSRSFTGNSVVWWRKERKGYTSDLSEAMIVDRAEALSMQRDRDTDRPWPVNAISATAARHVDANALPTYEPLT